VALVINTNIASINTQRYLSQTQNSLATAEQRLSSGLRINSARDDAAGLAIATRLSAQVSGDNVAIRNSNDGVSLAQTAEGALQQITTNLQTIRNLAVQSANASNSASDRAALQTQASSLIQEIDRVAKSVAFNGVNLLDGSFSGKQFQVGANAGETVNVANIASARTAKLGSSNTAAITAAQNNSTALSDGDLLINGINVGASVASADTASTASASGSAIAKAAAINAKSTQTGVTATVNDTQVGGTAITAGVAAGSVTINGVSITINTTASGATTRASVVSAINAYSAQTGVTAVDSGADTNGVKLVAADGRNVALSFTTVTAANTGLATAGTYAGSYTLNSSNPITLSSNVTGTISNSGLQAGTYQAQTAYVASKQGAAGAGTAIAAGDFAINGVLVGASLALSDNASYNSAANSAIAKSAAINSLSTKTGVTATANPNVATGSAITAAATSGILYINGVATGTISTTSSAADSRKAVVDAINAISGQTGVTALNTNSDTAGVQLVAADGRNITVTQNTAGTLTAASSGLNAAFITAQAGASATAGEKNAGTIIGTVSLSSTTSFTIDAGTTSATADVSSRLTASLGIDLGTYGVGKSGQSLDTVDLSTVDGSNKALTAIDNALASVSASSSQLGAIENRFQSVVANLQTTAENQSQALSRIQDADFAAETANYTRSNVLQQAATSILSQANSNPQQVLTLLQRL